MSDDARPEFEPRAKTSSTGARWVVWARWGLLLVGLAALYVLVRSVGLAAIVAALRTAGPWLPLVIVLELTWVGVEGLGFLTLVGPAAKEIPFREWLRAALVHFSTMMVLPVGRAGAEVARATLVSPFVGGPRASASAALMQSFVLIVNTIVSLICVGWALGAPEPRNLVLLLGGNALATLAIGGALYLVSRKIKVGGFLGRYFVKLKEYGPELDQAFEESRPRHGKAILFLLAGRSVQTLQYGVMFGAIVGSFSVGSTFVAQGVHLVGAGLGDMIPNQVGVTEGAFRYFAPTLGLGASPDKAIAIALVARISVLVAAGLAALALQLVPSSPLAAKDVLTDPAQ